MNSRERVLTSIAHRESDRVPVALWGGPYGLVDDLYFRVLDLLEVGDPLPPFRRGHTINHLDDRVLEALGVDTRYVWPGASPTSPRFPTEDPGFTGIPSVNPGFKLCPIIPLERVY